MTDYNPIPDNILEPDDPIPADLGIRWRDNPIAMFEGAPGAPNLKFEALGTLVAGSTLRSRNDSIQSTTGTDTMFYSFGFAQPGVIRLYAEQQHGGVSISNVSMSFRRWRAGVLTNLITYSIAIGTTWNGRTLDVSVIPGDTIVVYASGGAGGAISEVRNIRLFTNGGLLWPLPAFMSLE